MNIPDKYIPLMDEKLKSSKEFDNFAYRSPTVTEDEIVENYIVEFGRKHDIGSLKENNTWLQYDHKTRMFVDEGGFTDYFKKQEETIESEQDKKYLETEKLKAELVLIKKSINDLDHKKGMRPIEKWVLIGSFIISIFALLKAYIG